MAFVLSPIGSDPMVEGPRVRLFYDSVVATTGQSITAVSGTTKLPHYLFQNAIIKRWYYIGKHLYLILGSHNMDIIVRTHFMMFGRLYFNRPHPRDRKPNLQLVLDNGDYVAWYNASVKITLPEDIDTSIKPQYDVSNPEFSQQDLLLHAQKAIKHRNDSASDEIVVDFLLDQNIFPGVGNIIQQEALYRCKVCPKMVISQLSKDNLICLINQCHVVAIAMYDFSVNRTPESGPMGRTVFQIYHKAYDSLGHKTVREVLGVKQRRVTWCPQCQCANQ
jgi:endonuclease-8